MPRPVNSQAEMMRIPTWTKAASAYRDGCKSERNERDMLRRLYDWTMRFASGPYALTALVLVSFAESSFFPIPPDLLLIPMALAQRERALKLAAWCTVASVAGGVFGYAIGALLYDSLGRWLIELYGYSEKMEQFKAFYDEWGVAIIIVIGLTPVPYKLGAIASGFMGYNIWLFIVLSLLTRGARFFAEAALLKAFGEPMRNFIESRLEWIAIGSGFALVMGFVLVKLML
jgi:membrane protein YqaA with SNARE-associated domain